MKRTAIVIAGIISILILVGAISKLYYNQDIINERLDTVSDISSARNTVAETDISSIKKDIEVLYTYNIQVFKDIGKVSEVEVEIAQSLEKLAHIVANKNCAREEQNRIYLLKEKLKAVNVTVHNSTMQGLGSATVIKYNGRIYLLSAAHLLVGNNSSFMYMEMRENRPISALRVVKIDVDKDLVLFEVTNPLVKFDTYVELGSAEPPTGEDILVCGNPLGIIDVISRGIIITYEEQYGLFLGNSYFGNSGCGVFNNEGNLIGVMSCIAAVQPNKEIPPFKIDAFIRLKIIKNFLLGV